MKYGCIGEYLGHSFSKEIHADLSDYEYEIREVAKDALDTFMREGDFLGINVTIPYKEPVIPYLHYIDEHAREIGAVNTIVNREGKLYGYNTDFFGMCELITHAGVEIRGKRVAVLGTGGTSKTAVAVARALGAGSVIRVSRSCREGAVSYRELYENHADTEVIINTTPSGMFPNIFDTPVDLDKLQTLSGVIDAVYNPVRTPLVIQARDRGVRAEGGLYMLVAQAARACEIFLGMKHPEGKISEVYEKILKSKENIVLVGMPSSGKSTVGRLLSEELSRPFYDTDTMIAETAGMSIPEIFERYGEAHFRELEAEAIRTAARLGGSVIATGGGAVMREENVKALRENGRIYFIDRPLESLLPTEDRPLSSTREQIEARYRERYGTYLRSSDVRVDASGDAGAVLEKILEEFRV